MSMESPKKVCWEDIEPYKGTWRLVPKEEWENDPVRMKQFEEDNKFWDQVKFPEEILKRMKE